jgi:NADH-quinone oxidoreductase subunit A
MGASPEVAAAVAFTALCAALGVGMLLIIRIATRLLGTAIPKKGKYEPYECGVPKLGETRIRLGVRFYLIALLFILFDIETVFLLPYAVAFRQLGVPGFVEMLAFVGVLALGLFYLYRRGALEWE